MNRLQEIARYTKGYKTIVDFGCDHGLVIKYAIDQWGVKTAIAVDNKLAPLKKAQINLIDYMVTFLTASTLSQMFEQLTDKDNPNLIIITGLGAHTIMSIIDRYVNADFLVSAHGKSNLLRLYMTTRNYKIIAEKIVKEDSIYYELILFSPGKMTLTAKQLYTGIFLEKDELFEEYAKYNRNRLLANFPKLPSLKKGEFQKLIDYWSIPKA